MARLNVGSDVGAAPFVHDLAWRAGRVGPVPQFERHGNAEPRDTPVLLGREVGANAGDGFKRKVDCLSRRRIAVGKLAQGANIAEKIDQNDFRAAPAYLQAEEIGTVRIERHGHGRLPDLATNRLLPQQQAVVLQLAHDHRNRLDRKLRHARDVGLGQAATPAHQRKHEPLIMVAHAALVCAARETAFLRTSLNRPDFAAIH